MSYRIGPKQYDILRAIRDGKELWKKRQRWELDGKTVNRERAATLYFRGFLMGGRTENEWSAEYRQQFLLTDKGKAAL